MLVYGATLAASGATFNLIWRHVTRGGLLLPGVSAAFVRDVDVRYLLGFVSYSIATALALISPLLALLLTVGLALMFVLGPSPRPAFPGGRPEPDG